MQENTTFPCKEMTHAFKIYGASALRPAEGKYFDQEKDGH